ncbi:ArsR/SmtB family transcription factor [Bacillus sp. FSL K6-3431]|uniref:ArsR/SmtB family transcription factor n=1 Tax=Bacillus sp. FSL K6-3431 TaxID=2921500 RepID=UPI0030F7C0D4
MQINISQENLNIFEALASRTRIKIIELISEKDMNIKELSQALGITSSIVTRHILKLEEAEIIKTKYVPGNSSGLQKISLLAIESLNILFPRKLFPDYHVKELSLPVGLYTNFNAYPTCGLATVNELIGLDESKVFLDSRRVDASLVWISKGFLEYKIPNPITKDQQIKYLEVSLELSSEFPNSNNNWPSDISFSINGRNIGTWTCPGNFSDVRGKHTPKWWGDKSSQYGLLKHIRISPYNVSIDGEHMSDESIQSLNLDLDVLTITCSVNENSKNVGGLTLFGKGFGNWDKNIEWKFYYIDKIDS